MADAGSPSLHTIEELLLDDLTVGDGVQRGLVERHPLPRHWPGLGRHIKLESHDEAIVVWPWALNRGVVQFMVLLPPFVLAANGIQTFDSLGRRTLCLGLDADDIGAVQRLDRLLDFALTTEVGQFLPDLHRVALHFL